MHGKCEKAWNSCRPAWAEPCKFFHLFISFLQERVLAPWIPITYGLWPGILVCRAEVLWTGVLGHRDERVKYTCTALWNLDSDIIPCHPMTTHIWFFAYKSINVLQTTADAQCWYHTIIACCVYGLGLTIVGGFLSDAGWFLDAEKVLSACLQMCKQVNDPTYWCRALECCVRWELGTWSLCRTEMPEETSRLSTVMLVVVQLWALSPIWIAGCCMPAMLTASMVRLSKPGKRLSSSWPNLRKSTIPQWTGPRCTLSTVLCSLPRVNMIRSVLTTTVQFLHPTLPLQVLILGQCLLQVGHLPQWHFPVKSVRPITLMPWQVMCILTGFSARSTFSTFVPAVCCPSCCWDQLLLLPAISRPTNTAVWHLEKSPLHFQPKSLWMCSGNAPRPVLSNESLPVLSFSSNLLCNMPGQNHKNLCL